MILRKLTLENFRQFYGTQVIDIAPPGERNVTLIHAENGVGKTTLLNAVLWTFFETTTSRFEQRDQIINFGALTGGTSKARVEVEFDNVDNTYVACRELRETKGGHKKTEFQVYRIEKNGTRSAPLITPDAFIYSVIPKNMAQYFFFDGEQAEAFSSETNYKEVGNAIRDILGCSLLETAKGDLEYLARSYDKELGELEGEEIIASREKEIAAFQEAIDTRDALISEATKSIDTLTVTLRDLEDGLRKAQESAALQAKRDADQTLLDDCEKQIADSESAIIQWISNKALAIVSERLVTETLELVESESLRGRIPSPYNEEFVDNLLKAKLCICDRELPPGSTEWRAVQNLLKTAANAESMNRMVRVRSRSGSLIESRQDAPHLLLTYQTRLAGLVHRRASLQQSLADLSRKLEGLPISEIKEREQSRRMTALSIERRKLDRIEEQTRNEADRKNIERLRREVDELAVKNSFAKKLILRREVATQAATRVATVLVDYEQEARYKIRDTVNQILERVARRDYKLDIGENFELRMMFSNGRPLPKSGGENQLMSLAFIAALMQFAKHRSEHKANALFVPATVAPLILDSPFGQLDDKYRADTAAFIPEMAPQVILLVSSSQGKSEVVDVLQPRVGKEYVLIAENRSPRGAKAQEFLTLNGTRIETTLFDCSNDMTRIKKLTAV
jgi:DNA sulfur modification protein DndD